MPEYLYTHLHFISFHFIVEIVIWFVDRWGFLQCSGALDDAHISILVSHNPLMRAHDARLFANLSLFERSQNRIPLLWWKETIKDMDAPLVIFEAVLFPLPWWLMKPSLEGRRTTPEQSTFNQCLSKDSGQNDWGGLLGALKEDAVAVWHSRYLNQWHFPPAVSSISLVSITMRNKLKMEKKAHDAIHSRELGKLARGKY